MVFISNYPPKEANMKKVTILLGISGILAVVLFSCGNKGTNSNTNTPGTLDTSVKGKWQGAIGGIHIQFLKDTINFNGEKIFVHFSGGDSSFALITCDTTRAATPLISDTTLVLTGSWRVNAPKDTALLLCDTCRIIDTTLNTLVPRLVRGQRIPVFIDIARNPDDGFIEWNVKLNDLLPIAPLMGLNFTADPRLFANTKIVLAKMSQE